MKILILIFFCFSQIAISRIEGESLFVRKKEDFYIPKTKLRYNGIPPGTVKLNDSIYIDAKPVTNIMYLEFLFSVKYFWTLEAHDILKTLPDFGINDALLHIEFKPLTTDEDLLNSLVPNDTLTVNNTYRITSYLQHPQYSLYPVLGLSKKQAEFYCKWRTDIVNLIAAYNSGDLKERKKILPHINYRLPSKEELRRSLERFNYTKKKNTNDTLVPITPFKKKFSVKHKKIYFNEFNISEFISNDEDNFGTNWRKITTNEESNDYTGFRCACEIQK
ncbi:hypothetical protein N7U66_15965 [Lacinutrix neustonica]|uniref:Sulfatase-modifying factor enzyme-like domain-containing protein n=1 Tax=Lacinutrix neustonica TaxID=2980107 RepID=A0A9E8SD96_9FLAO|nr:SUMF1/EgtB/PvdO family nonheme iron enzyme [Lacinutrix neustonica]WAC01487.1 hypothetical protein N7U66_15965 [Lacinutrix neustonica]